MLPQFAAGGAKKAAKCQKSFAPASLLRRTFAEAMEPPDPHGRSGADSEDNLCFAKHPMVNEVMHFLRLDLAKMWRESGGVSSGGRRELGNR